MKYLEIFYEVTPYINDPKKTEKENFMLRARLSNTLCIRSRRMLTVEEAKEWLADSVTGTIWLVEEIDLPLVRALYDCDEINKTKIYGVSRTDICRLLCAKLEEERDANPTRFGAYKDEKTGWRIFVDEDLFSSHARAAMMLAFIEQLFEACLGSGLVEPVTPYEFMFKEALPDDTPEDLNVWVFFDQLPSVSTNLALYADAGEQIIAECEDAALAVAYFFESMGWTCPTGYYDPKDDRNDDHVDEFTGRHYVRFE